MLHAEKLLMNYHHKQEVKGVFGKLKNIFERHWISNVGRCIYINMLWFQPKSNLNLKKEQLQEFAKNPVMQWN